MRRIAAIAGGLALAAGLYAFQKPFRQYYSEEGYNNFPVPPDYREGNSAWTNDYPRSDRHFTLALRRLTRLNVRSVEQSVDPFDGDDVFNWPFLYCAGPDQWNFTDAQYARIREYLARGGFILGDDFWGQSDWYYFQQNMARLFPGKRIVEIPDKDAIFHTVYDLNQRYQVTGQWGIYGPGYLNGGSDPHWRAIYDDKGRILVAILFNHDTGDSWEWADDPTYPEKWSALGIRTGVNYVMYALTH